MNEHDQIKITDMNYNKDRPVAENPLKITDLSLRDGHQSLFATRGRTEDMIPVAEKMDKIGFWAVEVWGGATFDAMHRFLGENPWERLRTLKRYFKKTPLSMLLRGQNLVGYKRHADDVAKLFIKKAIENGIQVFRTFDALNDYRNFATVVKVIKENGAHFQGCVCYTLTEPRLGGGVYNIDYFVKKAKELEDMGADSICIKDMAGLIAPYDAYNIVKALKASFKGPVNLHSHFNSGMSSMSHLKAVEAGVDIIDTCLSPYAYRTSHPAIEPLVMSLLGTNRDTGFDISALVRINDILEKEVLPKYKHLMEDTKVSIIDISVLLHQIPGGMLSNLVKQLKEMNAFDRIDEVYKMLPKVRKDLGQVPLVTPTSQIVGTQTVNNVLFDTEDEQYKMITDQVKDLCYGLYGKTAMPIDPKIQKKVLKGYEKGEKPITCRPTKLIEPELKKAKESIGDVAVDEEDLLLYTMFPITGKKYLMRKYGKEKIPEDMKPLTLEDVKQQEKILEKIRSGELMKKEQISRIPEQSGQTRIFNVCVEGEYFQVSVNEVSPVSSAGPAKPSGSIAPPLRKPEPPAPSEPLPEPPASGPSGNSIKAPMPGMIIKYEKNVGDSVEKGETVVVIEAMKMENSLPAPKTGVIKAVNFNSGDSVAKNDVLAVIE